MNNRRLTYATVCSGVECMSAASIGLPLDPVFFSEIDPFPCAVLKARFPNVPNLGDMSNIEVDHEYNTVGNGRTTITLPSMGIDILAGGTPCQDVSNAGKRAGMREGSGTRSSLAFEFVRLVRELRPRFVLWENVAGVLSDDSFPGFLSAIANCGYGVAYRTIDAQFVRCSGTKYDAGYCNLPHAGMVSMERAIPQRRRRVWVVGCSGADGQRAAEILFERNSMLGDTPPCRLAGKGNSQTAQGCAGVHDQAERVTQARGQSFDAAYGFKQEEDDVSGTIVNGTCPGHHNGVVTNTQTPFVKVSHPNSLGAVEKWEHKEASQTLNAFDGPSTVRAPSVVVYENHPADSRLKESDDVSQTISMMAGTGGGEQSFSNCDYQ